MRRYLTRGRLTAFAALALLVVMSIGSVVSAEAPDLTVYTSAVSDIVDGISTAVPTMVVAVGAVAAGLLVITLGLRFLRKFVK